MNCPARNKSGLDILSPTRLLLSRTNEPSRYNDLERRPWPVRHCCVCRRRHPRAAKVLNVSTTLAPPVPHRRGFFWPTVNRRRRENPEFPPMKNTTQTIRPRTDGHTRTRPTPAHHRRQPGRATPAPRTHPAWPRANGKRPLRAHGLPFTDHAHDFLNFCLYPGMDGRDTAA